MNTDLEEWLCNCSNFPLSIALKRRVRWKWNWPIWRLLVLMNTFDKFKFNRRRLTFTKTQYNLLPRWLAPAGCPGKIQYSLPIPSQFSPQRVQKGYPTKDSGCHCQRVLSSLEAAVSASHANDTGNGSRYRCRHVGNLGFFSQKFLPLVLLVGRIEHLVFSDKSPACRKWIFWESN